MPIRIACYRSLVIIFFSTGLFWCGDYYIDIGRIGRITFVIILSIKAIFLLYTIKLIVTLMALFIKTW